MTHNLLNKAFLSPEATADFRAIGERFFKEFQITFFEHVRVFNNGTCAILPTRKDVVAFGFDQLYPITSDIPKKFTQLGKEEFCYVISPESDAMKYVGERFQMVNCLNVVYRQLGYYDMFSVTTGESPLLAANTYLSSIEEFRKFFQYFMDQSKPWLEKAKQDLIQLPQAMLPEISGLSAPSKRGQENVLQIGYKNLVKDIPNLQARFTKRQIDCIEQIMLGRTAREMASELNLSVRTVESYIEEIRNRLGCQRKSEIVGSILGLSRH